MNIKQKIAEAEAYQKHGLYSEALGLFEELLKSKSGLNATEQNKLKKNILSLKGEIDILDKDDTTPTAEDASLLRETWDDGNENVHEIVSSANAFKELGLHKEAVIEYSKLFALKDFSNDILPDMAECMFQAHSPSRVIDQIEKMISDHELDNKTISEIKFVFGQQMKAKGHDDLALEYFESVKEIDPEYENIEEYVTDALSSATYESKYDYLLRYKLVTTTQLQNALVISKKSKHSVEFVLSDNFHIDLQKVGKSLSLYYQAPFRVFDPEMPVPYELTRNLKRTFLTQNTWVPLAWELGGVDVLIDDPSDLLKTDPIPGLLNAKKVNYIVSIKEEIEKVIKHFYEERSDESADVDSEQDDEFGMMPDIDFEEEEELEDDSYEDVNESSGQIVRMVDQILISAYRKGSSDIHIEPSAITKKTNIRFRIDGVCQEVLQVPNSNSRAIMSRLKIMSNLDIAERRLPQDGKIKFKRKGIKPFELRMATLPTAGGFEDAVLRILAESGAMKLVDMGMNERNHGILEKIVTQPYGLILAVGPTGSGKTTTLHAALGHINKPGIKIWTAEDPVEISQAGLRQVECKPKIGLDFARVMRAFLRADPDVIMIGEMRDHETASIGVEASLTGHLVFSTLHTNSAPETVTRLLDMGLNPLNFSDAFLGVLAQRLIRRLCKNCMKKYHPNEEEFQDIVKYYGEKDFPVLGIEYDKDLLLYKTVGCVACNDTGYKGRAGVHEMMEGTKTIKRMIKNEATSEELFIQSAKEGMATIKQDGVSKVFQGMTDIKEIQRICVE
jgi:type II secretory ATPase GspE/PulE/Tfp pilus assembly ATPase PilB-like protein